MMVKPTRPTTATTKNTPVKLEHLIYLIYTSNFSNLVIRHVACGEGDAEEVQNNARTRTGAMSECRQKQMLMRTRTGFLSCGERLLTYYPYNSTHSEVVFYFWTFLFTPVKLIGVGLLTVVLLKRPSLATRKNQRLANGKVGI
jgi:hypothetical protein